jgi:EpsI family protein
MWRRTSAGSSAAELDDASRRIAIAASLPLSDRASANLTSRSSLALWVSALALAICYWDVMYMLANQWWSNSMYTHGFLIPIIAGYVCWATRGKLPATCQPSFAWGVPVLLGGLLLLTIGRAGNLGALQELSLLPVMFGVALLIGGGSLARALALPILYLLLMVPVWEVFTNRLHGPFQFFSASFGTALLRAVGIPVYRDGTFIYLPNQTLEVAQVCSGVNYLVAIAAVGIPLAYLSRSTVARRTALVLFGVMVAAIANGVRVALIGFTAYHGLVNGDLHGPGHVFHGMFVAVAGYVALFFGAPRIVGTALAGQATPASRTSETRLAMGPASRRGVAVAVALILLTVTVQHVVAAGPVPRELNADVIPLEMQGWKATASRLEESAVRWVGVDEEVLRSYELPGTGRVHLYVGYYRSQHQGKELIGESAAKLHAEAMEIDIALPSGERARVAELRPEANSSRHVLFWYDVNGHITADPTDVRLMTIREAILHRRSNAAIVAVTLEPAPGASSSAAAAAARRFAGVALPALRPYLDTAH